MIWQNSPYVVALIVTAAISFMLFLYCWGRRPDRAATYFALLLFAVSEWAFFSGLESSATARGAQDPLFEAPVSSASTASLPFGCSSP